MKALPPKPLKWLLKWLSPRSRSAEIEGDLNEVYQADLEARGRAMAYFNYFRNVLSLLNFGGYLTQLKLSNNIFMLRSIIKNKFRAIVRFRFGVVIGMVTLALGAATSGFLFYYINYETSYDGFHQESENIYRVNSEGQNDRGERRRSAFVPVPAGPKIMEELDEVVGYTRAQRLSPTLRFNNVSFKEERFFLVDNAFFEVFSFPIVQGNAVSPLVAPQSVVITESMAQKYFGDEDPIGQVIRLKVKKSFTLNFTEKDFTVTAVIRDVPKNTHLKFDFLASMSTLDDFKQDDWLGGVATYIKLKPGHSPDLVNQKFGPLIRENLGPYLEKRFRMTFDDYLASGRKVSYFIQPLGSIHTSSGFNGTFETGVRKGFLQVLLAVSVLIFALTAINYFNVSLATGLSRLREVGVRKSLGAFRHQVFALFFFESIVLSAFSCLLAFLIMLMIHPVVDWLQVDLPADFYYSPEFLLTLVLTSLLIGLISGALVAIGLSKTNVARGLKGSLLRGYRGLRLQKSLLGLQFFVAFTTLMVAVVFQLQNVYLSGFELGFNKDKQLVINNLEKISERQQELFMNELLQNPSVASASRSYTIPGANFEPLEFSTVGFGNPQESELFSVLGTEASFLNTYEIELLASLGDRAIRDSSMILINEVAMRTLGFIKPEDVLGRKLDLYGKPLTIDGVVSDFHYESLHNTIGPLVILSPGAFPEPPLDPYHYLTVKLRNDAPGLVAGLEERWKAINPNEPFDISYLQDDLERPYAAEQRLAATIQAATVVAIFIALLGLVSMSQIVFKVREKDLALRKVLGAGLTTIYQLFIQQFFWPLFLALLCALPLVVWYLDQWLSGFAYHISMGWEVFALSGLALVFVSVSVLSVNALKVAHQNPVKHLTDE